MNGRCGGVGDVAVVPEEEKVCAGTAAAGEQVAVLAVQPDRLLPLVISDLDQAALPGCAEFEPGTTAPEADRLGPSLLCR